MKKFSEYLKQHKTILIICVLLLVFVLAAVLLFDNKIKVNSTTTDIIRTDTETKLMRILSEIDGVGNSEVMVTEEGEKIQGVVIVCEGAQNIMVKNDVLNVVTTVLNVEKSNIAIYAMNK